jgi:TolA-binding protein
LLDQGPEPTLAAEAALVRGQILERLGRPDAALAMYDLVVETYAESEQFPQALWAAARVRDELDQDREAASLYERLATTLPDFPQIDAVLYHWAWALHDLDRREESLSLFERLRREHPQSAYWADATFRLAQSGFEQGENDRSRKLVAEIVARQTGDEIRQNALYLNGQIAAADERWIDASRSFERLLQEYPETSLRLLVEYGLAEVAFRQDDYEAAEERFDRLARQTRGRTERWLAVISLRLAQTLCHRKQWDEAYEVASKIAAEYPDFEELYEVDYVLGRCLSTRAEFEEAREAYRKVIHAPGGAKTETAAKAQLMIGESFYHQRNYQTALREYLALEILYDYPTWQAAAVFQAAKCHEMLGEWKEAAQQYARLVRTYPESSFTEEATKRLVAAKRRAAVSGS